METLKTDGYYNEDDFIQEDHGMRELTVEISLCEYRNLIRELTKADLYIEKLQIEKEELEKRISDLQKSLAVIKLPEWIDGIRRVFTSSDSDDTSANDDETEESMEAEEIKDG